MISLVLAIVTWFYVNEELYKEKEIAKQFYKTSLISQFKNPFHQKKSLDNAYLMEHEK